MESIINHAFDILTIALTIIGGASAVVAGLRQIAAITPNPKDDEVLRKVDAFLTALVKVLDKFALTPPDRAQKAINRNAE